MLSRRHLLMSTGLLALAACSTEQPPPDTAELDRWLRQYVELLNKKDEPALGTHLNRTAPEPATRISQFGGRDLTVDKITTSSEFPRVYKVQIDAKTKDGEAVRMSEVVEWDGKRWSMAPADPPSSGAATSR